MYKSPSFEISSLTNNRSQLALVAAKGLVSPALRKLVPQSLQEHAALKGEKGAKLVLHGNTVTTVIMGIGKAHDFNAQEAAEWGENAGHALNREMVTEVQVLFAEEAKDATTCLNFLKGLAMANYRMDELKSHGDTKRSEIRKVVIAPGGPVDKKAIQELGPISQGIAFARTLIELPPAHANPSQVVARFQDAVNQGLIEVEVWDEKRIKKEGMGLLEAVSRGSSTPARFLVARYGKDMPKNTPNLFLVGKGITFDTGGINLKVGSWIDLLGMKKDMGGAAAVLGAILAVSQLKVGVRVTAVTPLAVNAIDANAVLPGDVVKSYAGKTVEIMNTDAEGRLILADALHYAVSHKADYIVNVATLTGACMVALGHHHSGLFTNSDTFGSQVLRMTELAGEPAWKMPMSNRYGEELKSKVADMANMGKSREGGAQIGAKFLERFVEGVPWVHLDIAGTVDLGEPAAGTAAQPAAGRMVHSLVLLAQQLASKPASGKKKS